MTRLQTRSMKAAVFLSAAIALGQQASAADGDAAAGEKVFAKCRACHNVEEEKNKVGPHLVNLIGRQPGSMPGFKYSKGMTEFGEGKVWSAELLETYLPNPRETVKGTRMAFAGLKDPQEIADVIAYLSQFSKPAE